MSPVLRLEGVTHRFDGIPVVDNLSLEIASGEVVCLLGPSGCGKTTALRLAAGLEQLQTGRVTLGDREVAAPSQQIPPEERGIGLVFQDYALFPHLNVADNVAFGLTSLPKPARREKALLELRRVGMEGAAEKFPHELSGGQQQRVALARALAPNPRIILLDEPYSGLDTALRSQVRDDVLHLLKESGAATLMVTHDPEEAMFMADRIAVMRDGRIVQEGSPHTLYCYPNSAFVAGFFGEVNVFSGPVKDGEVETPIGPVAAGGLSEGTTATVVVRPEGLRVTTLQAGQSDYTARVMQARLLGRSSLIHLHVQSGENGGSIEWHFHSRMPGIFLPETGTRLRIDLDPGQIFVFPASNGGAT
ncbi:ABC transporter ATP-binding protein [Nisaea acidiphila]|uniref:ABC transporter ATP-binding protein n=1 Tax=Nisaea acidiphila TaxID=1862145 RepID=A0A9J7AS58_9PROT|nr:ABC transporter ATP-binding protein [Nisaea acidiphila]UUX50095.1 ABC transporter ATP-binding protein [Nisaea acidiphila]